MNIFKSKNLIVIGAIVALLSLGHVASAAPIPLVLEEPEVIYVPAPKYVTTNNTTYTTSSSSNSANAYNKAFNDAYNAGYSAGYNTGYNNASAKNTNVVYPTQVNTTYPNQYNTQAYPNQYNNSYPNTYNTTYSNPLGASAYGSQMGGGIYPNPNKNGNNIAALSLEGSGGFMPSSIWQWLLVIFLILVVIIIARMLGRKPEHHEVHTVTSH